MNKTIKHKSTIVQAQKNRNGPTKSNTLNHQSLLKKIQITFQKVVIVAIRIKVRFKISLIFIIIIVTSISLTIIFFELWLSLLLFIKTNFSLLP